MRLWPLRQYFNYLVLLLLKLFYLGWSYLTLRKKLQKSGLEKHKGCERLRITSSFFDNIHGLFVICNSKISRYPFSLSP